MIIGLKTDQNTQKVVLKSLSKENGSVNQDKEQTIELGVFSLENYSLQPELSVLKSRFDEDVFSVTTQFVQKVDGKLVHQSKIVLYQVTQDNSGFKTTILSEFQYPKPILTSLLLNKVAIIGFRNELTVCSLSNYKKV